MAVLWANRAIESLMGNGVKRHSRGRRSNVQHGDRALKFVMSGLVEEVTESDDADSLSGEVHRQTRRAAGKDTGDRVQFVATVAQVISGYDKIGCGERRIGREQKAILAIPKPMAGRLRQRYLVHSLHHGAGFYGRP